MSIDNEKPIEVQIEELRYCVEQNAERVATLGQWPSWMKAKESLLARIPKGAEANAPGFDAGIACALDLIPRDRQELAARLHAAYTPEAVNQILDEVKDMNPESQTVWWLAACSVCKEGGMDMSAFLYQLRQFQELIRDTQKRMAAAQAEYDEKKTLVRFDSEFGNDVPFGDVDGCLSAAYMQGFPFGVQWHAGYGIYFVGTFHPTLGIPDNFIWSDEKDENGRAKSGPVFGSKQFVKCATADEVTRVLEFVKRQFETHTNNEKTVDMEYGRSAVRELQALFADENYKNNVVDLRISEQQKALEEVKKKPQEAVRNYIKKLVEDVAASMLGVSVDEGKKKGKEWGSTLRSVTGVSYESVVYPVTNIESVELETELTPLYQAQYMGEILDAQVQFDVAKKRAYEVVMGISRDIDTHAEDPEFLTAMTVWGRSPDSSEGWGHDNKGFHAGVVHYFEYRQNNEKNGRFKNEKTPFGVQGFIDYSAPLLDLVTHDNLTDNLYVKQFIRIRDEFEQERLIVLLQPEGDEKQGDLLVIAFKPIGEPMRVISVIPSDQKRFEKAVSNELNPKPGAKERLNSLGTTREIISRSS